MNSISVVMPSYNQGRFIKEAIDSVLSQEDVSVELIVMDGGSTDETVDILRSYGDQLTFTSGPDDGQSWAINEGMRRTTQEVVCWLNSDDRFLPGALRNVLEAFASDPALEFVTGMGRNIEEHGSLMGDVGARPARLWELIHHRNSFTQPSCFMKRELWFDLGGLNEDLDYVMDWDLWIRAASAESVFLPHELSDNRSYADNKTNSGGGKRLKEIEQMVRSYTRSPETPVLDLYARETQINDPATSEEQRNELLQPFLGGMAQHLSGISQRGDFADQFFFSVTPRRSNDTLRVTLSSVARYVPSRKDGRPVEIRWNAGNYGKGSFVLEALAEPQEFELPFVLEVGEVATITAEAIGEGFTPVGYRPILGYFEKAGSAHE